MYINEVIRRVRERYPSEYSEAEMYTWCNEVSAMLAVEDRTVYRELRPPVAPDGTILLPEGVMPEQVTRIYLGGRELPRRLHSLPWGTGKLPPGELTVIYEEPYRPIRMPRYNGTATADTENDRLYISDCEFIPGDMLTLTAGGVTSEHIPLLAVEYDPDNIRGYILITEEGALPELQETVSVTIEREVTDKTVCDAPYDIMYIDYLLARIAQYQRDTAAYNTNMAAFDTSLGEYKRWLAARMPHEKHQFKNYW